MFARKWQNHRENSRRTFRARAHVSVKCDVARVKRGRIEGFPTVRLIRKFAEVDRMQSDVRGDLRKLTGSSLSHRNSKIFFCSHCNSSDDLYNAGV